ncbi:MAG TPA: OmpA family protein, partial [Candidatus Binataceae bacterium]
MKLQFFAAVPIVAAALIAGSATPGTSQQGTVAAVSGTQVDLVFPTKDLIFTVDDLAGKTKDLEVKESKTEMHIDLAADVLFDFDKSTLLPTARDALHQAASIIRENAKGSTVRIDGYTDSKGSD